MSNKQKFLSRRSTPWDNCSQRSIIENFIRDNIIYDYDERHPILNTTNKSIIINSYVPEKCPYCQSILFCKDGKTKNFINRYYCSNCNRNFTPTTDTLLQNHKISVTEWIEYIRNLIQYVSINAFSWNNKNAFTTSRYWLEKIFLLLNDYQSDIILSGTIWLDETFYQLRSDKIERKPNGDLYRGLSKNQMCIVVACTMTKCICFFECYGKPSEDITYTTFYNHIK